MSMALILFKVDCGRTFEINIHFLSDPFDPSSSLVYYNARNGWIIGIETIGVSKLLPWVF